jgi:hypothetical protein
MDPWARRVTSREIRETPRKDLPGGCRAFRGWFVGAGAATEPQEVG